MIISHEMKKSWYMKKVVSHCHSSEGSIQLVYRCESQLSVSGPVTTVWASVKAATVNFIQDQGKNPLFSIVHTCWYFTQGLFLKKCIFFKTWSSSRLRGKQLVTTAVAVVTARCTTKVVNIERAAISHLDVGGAITTVWTPVKADLPGHSAVSHCRMTTI